MRQLRIMKRFRKMPALLPVIIFFTITLTVVGCGGGGGSGGSDGGAANTAPTANDGTLTTDQDTPAAGQLSASDPDGDPLTYSIVTNGSKGVASITDVDTGSFTYTPNAGASGADAFTFKVNDGTDDSNTATVTVTINPVNSPPTADAGPNQIVNEQAPVALDGSGSSDVEDGTNLTYTWTQTSGPTVNLIDADTVTPSFVAPAVSASIDLIFQLEVTDSGALSDTGQVTVTVSLADLLKGSFADCCSQVDLESEGTEDWSHWGALADGSFNFMDGGSGAIGDRLEEGNPDPALRFTNNPAGFSWTNGSALGDAPVASDSETGVALGTGEALVGEGFRLVVPVDTTDKTLKVYVGAFSYEGRFTAEFDDGSVTPVDILLNNPLAVQKAWVVTLNFGASVAGKTLVIKYTLNQDAGDDANGSITLQAAALAPAKVASPVINPEGGSFTGPVDVTLTTPTADAFIKYTTDGSDPATSGTAIQINSGDSFTLNATASLRTKAFFPGFTDSDEAIADFTVFPASADSLSVFAAVSTGQVDLEAEGTEDWSHWGAQVPGSFNFMDGGSGAIGDRLEEGNPDPATRYTNNPSGFSWTNGSALGDTPVASDSETGVALGTGEALVGEGFRLVVPVDTIEKTLKVYVGAFSYEGRFTAEFDDGSVTPVDILLNNPLAVQKAWVVTLNFGASVAGKTLVIKYTLNQDAGDDANGSITLQAAALQ